MRKLLAFTMAMLLLSGQLLAQTRTITGKVTDASGAPIPNASVLLKGTTTGTTTKLDGTFSLTVPTNARALVVSSVGLAEQEVSISSRDVVDITMKADDKNLSEVVVVGY